MFYLGVTVEPSSKLFRVEFCLLSDKQVHFDILVYGRSFVPCRNVWVPDGC